MKTIFSSSSNPQKSAIKVFRISGNNSNLVPDVFSFRPTKPRVASLRKIYDFKKKLIDKALVIFFPGPKTSTGEDMFEIHIHGSLVIEKKVYQTLGKQDHFRVAFPGEFSKRAFLNGIIDLTQAEGLNDLINAETEKQFKLSISQYDGSLCRKLTDWRSDIVFLLSKLEALIDFADEELPNNLEEIFKEKTLYLSKDMRSSIKSSNYGERIRNGFTITLIGLPNVGKSSLINFLSKRKVSIVTEEPGTTRDIIEVSLDFNGFPVILHDTAGIRNAKSEVEKIGMDRAIEKANQSDLILILSDNNDFCIKGLNPNIKKVLVHTKSDLKKNANVNAHGISIKDSKGIEELIKIIVKYLKSFAPKENALLTNERQVHNVKKALNAIDRVRLIDLNFDPELASEDLRIAANAIGSITNIIDVEEILDDIFNKFCIGK